MASENTKKKLQVEQLRSVTHNIINMEFIKEETEEILIPDPHRVKDEDTEEKIGWFLFSLHSFSSKN